jgi:hypothetical protein
MVCVGVTSFSRSALSGLNGMKGTTALTVQDYDVCNKWNVPRQKIQDLRVIPSRKPDERNFKMERKD